MPAEPERILKALLRFNVSNADVSAAVRQLQRVEERLNNLDTLSNRVANNVSKAISGGGAQSAARSTDQLGKSAQRVEREFSGIAQQIDQAREKTSRFAQQGREAQTAFKGVADQVSRLSDVQVYDLAQEISKVVTFPGPEELAQSLAGSDLAPQIQRTAAEIADIINRYSQASGEFISQSTEQLRLQNQIALIVDRVVNSIGNEVTEEEQLYQIIRKIASATGTTTREAAEQLTIYNQLTEQQKQLVRQIGRDPGIVQSAKENRIAADAARKAADATRLQATEEEVLAKSVMAVASALRISRSEAAEFVAQMDIAGGRSAQDIFQITREFQSAERAASGFGRAMRFGIAGFTTQIIGVQIKTALQPFFELPKKFAEFAGMADVTASKFLQQSGRVEQVQLRIGRAIATSVLPVMERIADIAETIADFAEKNPGAIAGLVTVVGSLIGVATALQAIGFTLSGIGTTLNFLNLLGVGEKGAGAVGAYTGIKVGIAGIARSALPVVLSLLPAIIAAVAAYNILSKTTLPGHDKPVPEEASLAARQLATLVGGLEIGLARTGFQDIFKGEVIQNIKDGVIALGKFYGVIEDGTKELDKRIYSEQVLNSIASLLDQLDDLETETAEERQRIVDEGGQALVDAEAKYAKQRTDLIDNFQQQQFRELEDFQRQRTNLIRDFIETNQRAEEDYNRRRSDLIADANARIEQIEEDFRRKQIQDERDHLIRVEDLVAARDALGLARELRRFKDQQAADEQQNQARIAQERQNLQKRLDDLDEQFEIERQRRADDFQQRLADQQAEFNIRRAREQEDQRKRLAELDQQKREELSKIKENVKEQLDLLDERYDKEKENLEESIANQIRLADAIGITAQSVQGLLQAAQTTREQINAQNQAILDFMQNQIQQFQSSLNNQAQNYGNSGGNTGTGALGFQTGGYAGARGLYQLAEAGREYILNNRTTRDLESVLGGRISDKSLLALAHLGAGRRGRTGVSNISVQMNNWRFEGALTMAERQALLEMTREAALEGVVAGMSR